MSPIRRAPSAWLLRLVSPISWRRGLVSVREEVESDKSFVIQERWPNSEEPPMWTMKTARGMTVAICAIPAT